MAPQRKGVVPPATEKRLAELAALHQETAAQLELEVVKAMAAGGSYRELHRITGLSESTLARWVKRAGGLARVEADRARHAERRRILDSVITPEVRAMLDALDRGEAPPDARG